MGADAGQQDQMSPTGAADPLAETHGCPPVAWIPMDSIVSVVALASVEDAAWLQVGTLVVALLGVAASANLISGTTSRTFRSLKGLAELHALMPDGDAKKELGKLLDERVLEHAIERRYPEFIRWSLLARRAPRLAFGILMLVWPALIWSLLGEPSPWYLRFGMGAVGAAIAIMLLVPIASWRMGHHARSGHRSRSGISIREEDDPVVALQREHDLQDGVDKLDP